MNIDRLKYIQQLRSHFWNHKGIYFHSLYCKGCAKYGVNMPSIILYSVFFWGLSKLSRIRFNTPLILQGFKFKGLIAKYILRMGLH